MEQWEKVKVIKVINKKISGGYRFNLEGKPRDKLIELELSSRYVIPLKQGFGREVKPFVKAGEKVKAGQIIGRDDQGISSPVHASVNGMVESLTMLEYPQGGVIAVVIQADGTTGWQPLAAHNANWKQLSQEQIERLLYSSGVTSLDGNGIPTRFMTSSISNREVKDLIVQGIEDGPYHPSLSALLAAERCDHFIEGIKIMQKIMPQANIHLAINRDRHQLFQELVHKTKELEWLNLYPLSPKYPQSNDQLLTRIISNDHTKKIADTKKTVVLSVATLLQVHDAVVEGKPLIECTVALCGPGWKENLHLKVRIGTPVNTITDSYLQQTGSYRLIPNNLLTNEAITDLSFPIDRSFTILAAVPETTNRKLFSFLRPGKNRSSYSETYLSAFNPLMEQSCDTDINGETRPCIFCGYCEEICPVGNIPHLIDKHAKRNLINKELIRYGIFDCVECNLCTFVCPSKIPVAKHIKLGQQKLIEQGFKAPYAAKSEEKEMIDINSAEEERGIVNEPAKRNIG